MYRLRTRKAASQAGSLDEEVSTCACLALLVCNRLVLLAVSNPLMSPLSTVPADVLRVRVSPDMPALLAKSPCIQSST